MKRLREWSRRLKRASLRQSIERNAPLAGKLSRMLRLESLEDRRVMAVAVEAFTPTSSGFTAQLSEEIRLENLNLYDSQGAAMGAADVTLRGASVGDVRGSLIVTGTELKFVASGGVLPPDTYTATLRSAADGIVDAALGELLDGEFGSTFPSGNGTAGGNFVFSFTVSATPSLVVGLPDFARGPSQLVNVPAVGSGQAPQTGLPLRFSDTAGITSMTITIAYDPTLLDITDVALGPDAPAGSQVEANTDVTGQITIAFFSLQPLGAGAGDLVQLIASVPDDATYGASQVLSVVSLEVNAGAIQAVGDAAVHVVAFPGDANGNRRYDAEDARLIARVGVELDSGFVGQASTGSATNPRLFATIDPIIVGDVTGLDGISPLDASDILRRVVGLSTPNIPALPDAQAPTGLSLSSTTVGESLAIGTVVGTFTTSDPDAGDTFTYALVSGTGDTDNASFTISNNTLVTAAVFDAAVKSSYSIRVRTTDQTGRSFQRTFTISVDSTNQSPSSIALSSTTVSENVAIGTVVGALSTVDPDAGDTHIYTLVSGTGSTDNSAFTISGGNLVTATSLNFEIKSSYTVRVRSTDSSGAFVEQSFAITVTNVNEAPTVIGLSGSSVAEGAPIGTAVGTLSTTDPDTGDTHTYTLVTGTGSTDNAAFQVVGNQLRTAAVLDFETQATYSVRVRSTDAGGLSTESVFTITATGVNEAPTGVALSSSTVAENSPLGTPVGTLSTTDGDAGDTHTYSLVTGTGSTDNGSFTISGNQVVTAVSLNFETKPTYTIRVRSTDAGGLFFEQQFVITVTNVNESPTAIALSSTSVAEGAAIGASVGMLSTTDPDAGDSHVYTLVTGTGSTDNSSFQIVGNEVRTAAILDHDTQPTYSIRVRSTDVGGLFTEATFVINATAINEAPTAISLDNLTIAENQPTGTAVGAFSTSDPDAGNTHTYTLVPGVGGDDNASFGISGSTLQSAASFDFETKSSYTIRVRSTDGGGLFTEQSFVISITAANEAPTAISLDELTIDENEVAGTVVGTLSTTDTDATDSHTYTLVTGVGGDDNASFDIDGDTLITTESFDFEAQSSYSVRVRSTDAGGLFTEAVFVITVNDVNEQPSAIMIDSASVLEGEAIGTTVGTLSTADEDDSDTHTYTLVVGTGSDDNDSFEISGDELVTAESFDFSVKSSYTVRVRSTDAAGLFTEDVIVISVTEINVAPTALSLDELTIDENEVAGTVVGTLSTTDANVTDSHTYTIVPGVGGDDNASFDIDGDTLITTESFDFEAQSSYSVRVRSTDAGGLFTEAVFVITVNDVNEQPTLLGIDNSAVADLSPAGTVIGSFFTTDPDAGDTHTYSLVTGTGDDHNASFEIVDDELRALEELDFTATPTYSVRVQSEDQDGLTIIQVFLITELI